MRSVYTSLELTVYYSCSLRGVVRANDVTFRRLDRREHLVFALGERADPAPDACLVLGPIVPGPAFGQRVVSREREEDERVELLHRVEGGWRCGALSEASNAN
uniref:Uncharacterized protein n=1 Tax=Calcidiscus leptoporus TaxID=127549 RepID=A0A7S0J308_9EUKA